MVVAVIVFIVLRTMWGDYSSDGGFLTGFAVVIAVMVLCVALIVRHTRIWIDLHEEGFRIERPGRRPVGHTWRETAAIKSERVRVVTDFSHSQDVLKTVIVPTRAPGSGSGRWTSSRSHRARACGPRATPSRASSPRPPSVSVPTGRQVSCRAARRWRSAPRADGVHQGRITVTPFTDVIPWIRGGFGKANPEDGVRLRVAGLAQLVGSTALSSQATKAGYRTEGDLLKVWDLLHRPGTDYVALRIMLAEASSLPA